MSVYDLNLHVGLCIGRLKINLAPKHFHLYMRLFLIQGKCMLVAGLILRLSFKFKSFHVRTSGVIHKGDTSSPRVSRLRHRLWKVFASRPPGAQNRRGDRPLSLFAACLPCVYFASEQNKHQSCNGIAITYLSSRAIESGKKIRCKVAS